MNRGDRILTAFLAGAVASALVAHGRIDGLLAAMHPAGAPARGLGSLLPLTDWPDAEAATAAIGDWKAASPQAEAIAHWAIRLDFVIAIALPIVLWRLLTYVRAHLGEITGQPAASYRGMVEWARAGAVAAGVFDCLENAGLWRLVGADEASETVLRLTWIAAWLKWATLAAAVAPLLIAGGWLLLRGARRARTLRTLAAVRVQAVLAALFAFLLFGPVLGPQAGDVILRWVHEPDDAVIGALVTILLALLLWRTADWLVHLEQQHRAVAVPGWALPAVGGVLLAAGLLADVTVDEGRGLWPLGAILLVIAGLGWPIREIDDDPYGREPLGTWWTLAPALVGGAVPIAAGLAVVGATAAEWLYSGEDDYGWVVLGGCALQLAGWALIATGSRRPAGMTPGTVVALAAGIVVTCLVTWRVLANPWRTADFLGALGVYAAAGCALALLATVVAVEHKWRPVPALVALRLQRLPVLAVLAAWAIAAALQDQGGYHDVRTLTGPAAPVSLDDAWSDWVAARDWENRTAVPLVLVAASGGGIRAAYWTAKAMDCAIDGRSHRACGGFRNRGADAVFLASGISGGSVGLAQWSANQLAGNPGGWVDHRLGEDFLAPALAWTLFADLPSALLHTDFGPDRAEVLERAWEQSWTDRDRSAAALLWRGGPRTDDTKLASGLGASGAKLPLLHFGSTSVRDGCRISVSRLDGDEGGRCTDPAREVAFGKGVLSASVDAFDVCPDRDLRLSSAALLSARFPIVSPSGRLGPEDCGDEPLFGVDGGYFDNTAASPVLEIWDALEPKVLAFNREDTDRCIVPVLLQLDNSYVDPAAPDSPRRPLELAAPLQTFGATRAGREANSRQAAALRFGRRFGDVRRVRAGAEDVVRYVHLFPQRHPGTTAPLGWTLSRPSMKSLRDQLYAGENAAELEEVRRWFHPRLRCE